MNLFVVICGCSGAATDRERRHDFDKALAKYSCLFDVCPSLGYEVFVVPKVGVVERADFVLTTLAAQAAASKFPSFHTSSTLA
jgi:predicted ATPase